MAVHYPRSKPSIVEAVSCRRFLVLVVHHNEAVSFKLQRFPLRIGRRMGFVGPRVENLLQLPTALYALSQA